jgi:cell division control protein 6
MALKDRYTFFDSKVKQRAKQSLNEYDKESLGRLSALLVGDYGSDAMIGIRALQILGRSN